MQVRSHQSLFILALAMLAIVASREGSAQTARTIRVESTAIGGQATVAVLLPVDYDTSTDRYPVLYLLHGGTQNHTAFPARNWFTKHASARHMIVVMPYLQPVFFTARGAQAAPFEEFLGRELPSYIDTHYRTSTDRRGRAIAGISMGGFGATMVGLTRPDMFGAIGAISAALAMTGRQREIATRVSDLSAAGAPYFYVACGLQDPVLPASRELVNALRERGIPSQLKEVPGGHGWEVWDPQVRAFFDVLEEQLAWRGRAR